VNAVATGMNAALRLEPVAAPGSFLWPAGLPAALDQAVGWTLLIGAVVVTGLVLALLAWAVPGRRRRWRHPAWWTVGAGLVLPGAVLAALQWVNVQDLTRGDALPRPLLIGVQARAWWWEVRVHPDGDAAPVVLANELRLPVGRTVQLALSSDDLIHSLWLPALAGKVDLVPGRIHQLRLRATEAGRWSAPCAEYCGSGHTAMALQVVAQPAPEFERWLQAQRTDAPAPSTVQQAAGRAHFERLRCNACHRVRGHFEPLLAAPAGGPDLTHLASRATLGAGVLRNDAEGLRRWITALQAHKPGARMPAYPDLDPATLDALVAWLGSLD
jgi:cytochrome c oxidase subunit 2